jgi:hypothetical protein
MGSADDWPPPITRVPRKPKVAQFCAAPWPSFTPALTGAIAEVEITSNLPAATQLLSPRNYMNTGSTAAAVAYDCSGVYVETDY